MKTSDMINEIAADFAAAQGELTDAAKDQKGYGYQYADLSGVLQIARPVLSAHKICAIQEAATTQSGVSVTTRLCHASGQWIEFGPLTMEAEPKKGLSHAQCVGSVITYARRYALAAALGITQEDDDGASGKEAKRPQKAAEAPQSDSKPAQAVKDMQQLQKAVPRLQGFIHADDLENVIKAITWLKKELLWQKALEQLTDDEKSYIDAVESMGEENGTTN